MSTPLIHCNTLNIHFSSAAARSPSAALLAAALTDLAEAPRRAVSKSAASSTAGDGERFTLSHGDAIVTDHKTGIMWPVYESESAMDCDELAKYIAAFRLGDFSDWFNPNLDLRESIRDLTRYAPALFPPLKSRSNGWEWTSTPYAPAGKDSNGSPRALWQVIGCYGYLSSGYRLDEAFARPCRLVGRASQ